MITRACAVLLAEQEVRRLGEGPLAFVVIQGRTLLGLSVSALEDSRQLHGFVVVAPSGLEREVADVLKDAPKIVAVVPGGSTRPESIRRALDAIPPSFDVVVLHEVAEPLATPELFDAVIGALDGADVALPQLPVADTLKRVEGGVVRETVAREDLGIVQFPQAFRREILASAGPAQGEVRSGDGFSLFGGSTRVVAVPGEPANVKVSTPEDLRIAGALLAERFGGTVGR